MPADCPVAPPRHKRSRPTDVHSAGSRRPVPATGGTGISKPSCSCGRDGIYTFVRHKRAADEASPSSNRTWRGWIFALKWFFSEPAVRPGKSCPAKGGKKKGRARQVLTLAPKTAVLSLNTCCWTAHGPRFPPWPARARCLCSCTWSQTDSETLSSFRPPLQ